MATVHQNSSECVNVVVRCRPLADKEKKAGHERVVDMDTSTGVILLKNPNKQVEDPREFTFDFVYDWNSQQLELYDKSFRPLVDAVLEGYNGTIFAYGQTGTGKTYTMEGVRSDPDKRGVIPNSFDHIFSHINKSENQQYLVRASYLEIYQEEIRDLLSKDQKKRLELKEHPDTGVYVKDLSSFIAKSVKEIEHVMTLGNQNRAVGPTDMNEHSSRSHAIFIVTVECSEVGVNGDDHIRVGKLNLVDLAGSERQSKTQSTGDRFKEAIKINLSLSTLGNVISALVNAKSSHIPYRDSKLTFLLRDSLGGNSKTVMVANIGPASYNYEETLVTLRYANRAKNIKNKPHINEDPKDALLREYQDEIKRLKDALEGRKKGGKHSDKHKKKKKSKSNGITGQHPDNSSSEEEDSGDDTKAHDEERNEEMLKKLQEKLEEERKLLQGNTEMVEEEKQSLLKEMHKKVEEVKNERKKLDQLASKIKAMESKLLSGGGVIKIAKDQRDLRKKDIQQKRDEMIEMKKRAQNIQKELEERAETNVEVQSSFLSLNDETSNKEKKLKKLQKKLKSVEAEIEDCKMEQYHMREDLNQQLLNLEKEMKLRLLIIEHFIPKSEVNHIQSSMMYDEENQSWCSKTSTTTTAISDTSGDTTSTTDNESPPGIIDKFTVKHNILLNLDLDMPTRTTCDYEGPQVTPTVQAVIDKAIEDPEDVTIDASVFNDQPSISTKVVSSKRSNSTPFRMKEKMTKTQIDPNQQFPEKRGLVKTK